MFRLGKFTVIYPSAIFLLHPIRVSLDDHAVQAQLTPEERRELLRAFADRRLLKVTAMDDPADLPGVEKAMRVAARAERQKLEPKGRSRTRHP